MDAQELGNLNVPGIDLEPLDPFLDDVFAGLDDHPPGLWHPTLVEAPAVQQQLDVPQSLPWEHASGLQDVAQSVAQMTNEELQGMSASPVNQQLLMQQEAQHGTQQEPHESCLTDHIPLSSGSSQHCAHVLTVPNHHSSVSVPILKIVDEDMQASTYSNTMSTVSSAKQLAASSGINKEMLLHNDCAAGTADTTAEPVSHGLNSEDHVNTLLILESAEGEVPTVSAMLDASEALVAEALVAVPVTSPEAGTDLSEGSVPDIDDVPEQQLASEPAVSLQHQQQQCFGPPLAQSEVSEDKQVPELCYDVHVLSHGVHVQLASIPDLCKQGSQLITPASQQLKDSHVMLQQQGGSILQHAAISTEVLEDATDDAALYTNDSCDLVSPSASQHTCSTHGSHMTSHSAMSATAVDFTSGHDRNPQQLQEQPGAALSYSDSSCCEESCSRAAAALHEQDLLQPASSPVLGDAIEIFHVESAAAAAAAHSLQPADEQQGIPISLAAVRAGADQELHHSQSHHGPTVQQSQELQPPALWQRQQQQEEPWQDVSPPSLGSSPPTPSGYTTVHAMHTHELPAAAVQADTAAEPPTEVETPESTPAHSGESQRPCHPFGALGSVADSSYVLRQSELVDLSLSSSVHPSQQQQQFRPSWLTAHQYLPPAAALAVERAACALNDSYFFHERLAARQGHSSQCPMHLPNHYYHHHQQQQQQQQHKGSYRPNSPTGSSSTGTTTSGHGANHLTVAGGSSSNVAGALGSSAMLNPGLLSHRSSAAPQWSRAVTQPQQDQHARHSVPSQGPSGVGAWSRPGVLSHWFTNTLQQPLAAAASRAVAGVGQRLASAGLAGGVGVHRGNRQGLAASDAPGAGVRNSSRLGPDPSESTGGTALVDGVAQDAVLVERTDDMPQSLQEQEDMAFQGLLFLGGRDSHSRPVVIVNTDAIPVGHNAAPRDAALAYLLKKLTPIVSKGPYVLVMVSFHTGSQFRLLPGVWCVRAYHQLPYAFRKNVKHVLLLQPSWLVRAGLAVIYPFVSSKAHAKIKQVHHLLDIEAVTAGEVQVPHLGEAFLTAVQHISNAQQQTAAAQQSATSGSSRTVPVPGVVVA